MRNITIVLLLIPMFYANLAFSQIYDGKTTKETTLGQLVSQVKPGTILFLGESHGVTSHRDQHIEVLNLLKNQGLKVSVGMEFINYTQQLDVDQFRNNEIDETQFLTNIKWGAISFDFYRQQILFPNYTLGEKTLGLNLPRTLTTKISKLGLISLTEEDLKIMPPNFELGAEAYKKRFFDAAGAHCKNFENCFTAQCAWDDTMAWQASEFIKQHPEQVLVIVVGEFHVQYGGGTPARLLIRHPEAQVVTLSQIWAEGLTDEEIRAELAPSLTEGPRADFIWVSRP